MPNKSPIARSKREAGEGKTARDGALPALTSIDALTTLRVAGSYSAQCTAAKSPQRPSRSSFPSRSASPMPRHRSESTAKFGHGRCVGAAERSPNKALSIEALPELCRHVAEPCDDGAGQIDAGDGNQN